MYQKLGFSQVNAQPLRRQCECFNALIAVEILFHNITSSIAADILWLTIIRFHQILDMVNLEQNKFLLIGPTYFVHICTEICHKIACKDHKINSSNMPWIDFE